MKIKSFWLSVGEEKADTFTRKEGNRTISGCEKNLSTLSDLWSGDGAYAAGRQHTRFQRAPKRELRGKIHPRLRTARKTFQDPKKALKLPRTF